MGYTVNRLEVGLLGTNCYILSDTHRQICWIIDPGGESERIAAFIRGHALTPRGILLTHTHFDHIIGLSDLKSLFGHDLPIYASAKAADQLGSAGEAAHHRMVRSLSLGPDLEHLFIKALTNLPEADYLLFDDLFFDDASASESAVGGLSEAAAPQILPDSPLTAYPTPGHSPDSICFYLENTEGGILFSGDTLFRGSVGRTDLPGGNGRTLLHSIKTQLLSLPGKTAVDPGHGEPTTIAYEKAHNPFIERN
jgi:hydroxyacylglutathione hydrolase